MVILKRAHIHWVLPEEPARPFIKKALDLGINFFDTANMYSIGASEEILGRAIKDYAKRDEDRYSNKSIPSDA